MAITRWRDHSGDRYTKPLSGSKCFAAGPQWPQREWNFSSYQLRNGTATCYFGSARGPLSRSPINPAAGKVNAAL